MRRSIFIFILLLLSAALADDRSDYIRSHYAKYEFKIPMRDGAKLFTSVYVPYDRNAELPILLQRTPYSVGPYGAENYPSWLGPTKEFEEEGFIVSAR